MPQRLTALLWALFISTAVPGFAQLQPSTGAFTPQQQQVSFDYNGKMMRLTWEFEKQFAILRSYPYLHEARLFQTNDTTYTLEASHIVDGKLERELKPLTVQEVARIRYETSDALRSFAMWGNEERTAVWEDWVLGAGTLGWGLGFGAVTDISYRNQLTSSQLQASLNTWWITSLASTGGYAWAVHQPWYSRASATMWTNGLLQGTAHGWAFYLLFAQQNINEGDFFLTGIIGGGMEASIGLALSHIANMSQSQAQMITSFGASGLYVGILSQFASGNNFRSIPSNEVARIVAASVLVGSAAGMWIGNEIAKSGAITGGDAQVMTNPVGIFSSAPLSILSASPATSSVQLISGLTIGVIIGGNFLGSELVRDKDFSFLQGRIISLLSGIGGYLPSFFITSISTNGQAFTAQSRLLTSAIASLVGGIAGFTIPYLIYAKEAEEQHQRRLTATGAQANAGFPRLIPSEQTWLENLAANTDVQFSPLGLLPLLTPTAASVSGFGVVGLPIMSIRTVLGRPAPQPFLDDDKNEFH